MMIAARNAMLMGGAGPSTPTARDYVQSGLVAMWDGIENAGWGQHDATATVWKDLSNSGIDAVPYDNCDATWTRDSLSFTERGNYRASLSDFAWPVGNMCIDVVIRQNVYGTWVGRIFQTQDDEYKRLDICVPRSVDSFGKQVIMGTAAYDVALSRAAPPMAQTFSVLFSTTQPGFVFRFNGVSAQTATRAYPRYKPDYLSLGGNFNSNRNFLGEICCIRLYSRHPTNTEIDFNHAVDAARFNL